MPPTISNYGDHDDDAAAVPIDYNNGVVDDAYDNSEKGTTPVGNTAVQDGPIRYDDSEKGGVKSTTNTKSESEPTSNWFDDDGDDEVTGDALVDTTPKPTTAEPVFTRKQAVLSPSSSNEQPPSYPNPIRRINNNVNPSFMEPEKIKSMAYSSNINNNNVNSSNNNEGVGTPGQPLRKLPTEASHGTSSTSHISSLNHHLEHLTNQIYQLNDNGVEFNINSPKQVAAVLFGEDTTGDTSTNKDVLEAMASNGNEMA